MYACAYTLHWKKKKSVFNADAADADVVQSRAVELLLRALDRLEIPVEKLRGILLVERGVDDERGAVAAVAAGLTASEEATESAAAPAAELDQSPSKWDVIRSREETRVSYFLLRVFFFFRELFGVVFLS